MSELECLRAILGLSRLPKLERILDEVLGVLLEYTGFRYGYVEVLYERADPPVPTFRARARSDEHVGWIQHAISRGILGHARIDGRTIVTASAIDDARFCEHGSVREHQIGAVVCSPFDGFWTSGVIYLQGGGGVKASSHRGRPRWSSSRRTKPGSSPSATGVIFRQPCRSRSSSTRSSETWSKRHCAVTTGTSPRWRARPASAEPTSVR
jgi:hypothetical protein